MTELLSLSVAMFAGLLMTRPLSRFHLPDVTAYLIAGVLMGCCTSPAWASAAMRSWRA